MSRIFASRSYDTLVARLVDEGHLVVRAGAEGGRWLVPTLCALAVADGLAAAFHLSLPNRAPRKLWGNLSTSIPARFAALERRFQARGLSWFRSRIRGRPALQSKRGETTPRSSARFRVWHRAGIA